MKKLIKYLFLSCLGGVTYCLIELMWRNHTHWSMGLVGSICFIYAGMQNEFTSWDKSLLKQMAQVTVFITVVEFIAGCILNLWLKWDIWDYSNVPFNILGQICMPYCVLWFGISLIAILVDDYVRYWFFDEEKPRYKLF